MSLETLLGIWKSALGELPAEVHLNFAEPRENKRAEWEATVNAFRSRLPALGIAGAKLHAVQLRGREDFHDRRIEFTAVEDAAATALKKRGGAKSRESAQIKKRITVEVSGGLDRLVAEKCECCLYRFEPV